MSARARLATAAAAVTVMTSVLAGCSLIPDPVRDIVDQAQEGATLGSLPEGFPTEVPLVEGDILVGLKPSDTSWSVTIGVADESAVAEAATLLEDAGYVELIEGSNTYTGESYIVVVQSASVDGGGTGVLYVVTAK